MTGIVEKMKAEDVANGALGFWAKMKRAVTHTRIIYALAALVVILAVTVYVLGR